jgi:hypothetical protein
MKLFSICITLILLVSGIGAVAIDQTPEHNSEICLIEQNLRISSVTIKQEEQNYVSINLEEQTSLMLNPGKPIIPKITKTFQIPFGATNINVKVEPKHIYTTEISQQIRPSPAPQPLSAEISFSDYERKDDWIYQSHDPYPSQICTYNVGVGLNNELEHVTFVTVHLYPIRYIPAENRLTIAKESDIILSYEKPNNMVFPETFDTEYDMVLIAPSLFSTSLQKLIDHKNEYGIQTFLKTTE